MKKRANLVTFLHVNQSCTDSEIFLFGQRTTDNGQTFFSTDNGHRTTDKKIFGRTTDTDNGQPKIDGQRTTDSGQRTKFFWNQRVFSVKNGQNCELTMKSSGAKGSGGYPPF
ncbi:hypothetical protein B9Z55_027684 [Caenorhabditis nigoni]|uniref:Uncharacterized protein n=1 Tax=Caenorhabditis nigoni TaxID=1611254 RepID=A0A2G5SFC1_9PELO|nr:hypothetical protein B9Z55_027684 [Caenorhabditis nigoni]